MVQHDVTAFDVAEIREASDQRSVILGFFLGATRVPQHPNSGDFTGQLRTSETW